MKAMLLRSIVAAGEPRRAGDIVSMSQAEFDFLFSRGLVKAYDESAEKKEFAEEEAEEEPQAKQAKKKQSIK